MKPADSVKALLGKLHSRICSRRRGSKVSKKADLLYSKFTIQAEKTFENLPKPLKWPSFYEKDLLILMDIAEGVQKR